MGSGLSDRLLLRRTFLAGTARLGALGAYAGLVTTPALASMLTSCTATNAAVLPPTGDITDRLAAAKEGERVAIEPGIWLVSRDIAVAASLDFAGGTIRPAAGVVVDLQGGVIARPGEQIFDLAEVSWRRGASRRATRRSSYAWETDCGIRLGGTVYASWFGAVEDSRVDNSLQIQAMLDCGAKEATLDGLYTHAANWVSAGQTLQGLAPLGGDGKYGLRTIAQATSFAELWENRDPRTPAEDAFRGLTTKSNAGAVVFRDFEYDGNVRNHFDHMDQYNRYRKCDDQAEDCGRITVANFRRPLLRQAGIVVSMGESELDDETYVSPESTLIERVYIHDTVRSSIVGNRAPALTIRDCALANSDLDHLVYADRNPDLLIEGTSFNGYAVAGMVVMSCGTIRNCAARALARNPIEGVGTSSIIAFRNDLQEPSVISGLSVAGDLSSLGGAEETVAVFSFIGLRRASVTNVTVRHDGPDDVQASVFLAKFSTREISIRDVDCTGMPAPSTLWNSKGQVDGLKIEGVNWSAASSNSAPAPALLQFDRLANAQFDRLSVGNGQYQALVSADRLLRNVEISGIETPGSNSGIGVIAQAPVERGIRIR